MAQLTKGMYGSQFERASRLFGLSCGQIRGKDFVHNGGWYNKAGEKLGWGDLAVEDFQKIRRELEEGEMFIILGEQDSFWNFTTTPGLLGHNWGTKPTIEAPGVDYVAAKARFIITKDGYHFVDDHSRKDEWVNFDGLEFRVVPRANAKVFLEADGAKVAQVS